MNDLKQHPDYVPRAMLRACINLIGQTSGAMEHWPRADEQVISVVLDSVTRMFGDAYLDVVEIDMVVAIAEGSGHTIRDLCCAEGGEQWWSDDIDKVLAAITSQLEVPR